jgi:hypothetical protein
VIFSRTRSRSCFNHITRHSVPSISDRFLREIRCQPGTSDCDICHVRSGINIRI